jgi:hypothetical protein
MSFDDFEEKDSELVSVTALVELEGDSDVAPRNIFELRDQLVRKHHAGANSLLEKLEQDGNTEVRDLIMVLVSEIIRETDHLLGNELVTTKQGDLRDASVISIKRVEAFEKALKALQAKAMMDGETGVDVNSPAVLAIFKFFMEKVKTTMVTMGMNDEFSDTFFTTLSTVMTDWKKELRRELKEASGE